MPLSTNKLVLLIFILELSESSTIFFPSSYVILLVLMYVLLLSAFRATICLKKKN